MKRFLFSRARNHQIGPQKDEYDPDQRPISLGTIVAPNVRPPSNFNSFMNGSARNANSSYKRRHTSLVNSMTSLNTFSSVNSLDFRNSLDTNDIIQTSDPFVGRSNNMSESRLNDVYSEGGVRERHMKALSSFNNVASNSRQFLTGQSLKSSLSHTMTLIKKPLPSFPSKTTADTFSCEYEPSEVKDPNTRSLISRFIKSSHQVDLLKGYQSQIIDDSHRQQDFNPLIKKEFLAKYLHDHTKHENAFVIQQAFRIYLKRRSFNRFIRINIQIRRNLTKLTFITWRLSTENDPVKLKQNFFKLKEVYNYFCQRFEIRQLAPFRLFYITQQLFLPDGYTPEFIYQFFYLMHCQSMSKIMKEWAHVARNRIRHRKMLAKVRFSMKKFSSVGYVYHIFVMWQRYTEWVKENRNNPTKKYIKLKTIEISVFWNVREAALNSKRSRIKRATEFSIKRVSAKAVRALYNRSIESYTRASVNQTADIFRNRTLQALAHRAWLRYMQKRLQELQVLRDAMKSWYSHVYSMAKVKARIKLAETLSTENFLIKVMNNWFKTARMLRMRRIRMALRIQKKPSSMFMVIFMLRDEYELSFQALCYRMWIRFVRARKRWTYFTKWCRNPELEKERQMIVLNDLKRASHLKIVRRGFVSTSNFFPRHTWVSLELTMNALLLINQHTQKSLSKTENTEDAQWKFLTEKVTENEEEDVTSLFNAALLSRCFLLKLHDIKKYEICKLHRDRESGNPDFEKFRSLEELEKQLTSNIILLRRRTIDKVRRDHAILSSFVSHISAHEMHNHLNAFTTCDRNVGFEGVNGVKMEHGNLLDTIDLTPICTFPDVDESIEFLVKTNYQAAGKITSTFQSTCDKVMSEFSNRLRDPNYFTMKLTNSFSSDSSAQFTLSNFQPGSSLNSTFNKQNGNMNTSAPIQNNKISAYVIQKPLPKDPLFALVHNNEQQDTAFTILNLKRTLDKLPTLEDIILAISSFFNDVCMIQLDITETKSLVKLNEICTDVEQSVRHQMQKHLALFMAEIAGFSNLDQVPLKIHAPTSAVNCVSAIFTIHDALKKTSLSQYCDECPFSSKHRSDDKLLISSQEKLWNALRLMFPGKLDLPNENASSMLNLSSLTKRRGNKSTVFNMSGSTQNFEETLGSGEAFLACYLLPYILNFDSVIDFVRDEMVSRKATVKKGNS
ncbi:hypothetical protein TRFO_33329 [Tritrichomonas foetus]|uniref:IQ calmodulin-binding motif family protein n=1 Tax=Tritrichomonas foetus TaxID=1144522 RepID=A0A1J4JRA8_9EUKA|nr:hypothetical protein TRFO_33329 [Tritrichomonas foetus]|eukprot:OHT00046.1 hypothetical protein TRFO_33329 [Tritrichomonas foetus]